MVKEKYLLWFGFSLLELLVVLSIITILASIAYPQYRSHIASVRHTEAKIALADLGLHLEEYYVDHNSYEGATLENLKIKEKVAEGFYKLRIELLTKDSYLISAVLVKGSVAGRGLYKMLSLDQEGNKRGW